MKALLSKTPGKPDALVLEDVPALEPGKGEIVIDVKAVGVNYPDVLIIQDMYQFKPERPFSPGGELSGIVKSVGEGVTKVKVGDRVMGSIGWGGMAEEAKVDEARVRPFPDSMSFEEAAALLMTYGTSYYALKDRGNCKAGESLLVLGAAGGVGLAAVELGAAMGMEARTRSTSPSRKAQSTASSIRAARSSAPIRKPSPTRSRSLAAAAWTSSMTGLAATMPNRPCAP